MHKASEFLYSRKALARAAAAMALMLAGGNLLIGTAHAQMARRATDALPATQTMRGADNNYVPRALLVRNLGTGFVVSGQVLRSDTGAPASNVRIQMWAATERGGDREPSNRGSVMTGPDGRYRLEMSPIVPQFGQPHLHMAYDDGEFQTLFLRTVLKGRSEKAVEIDMVLAPVADGAKRSD